MSDILSYPEVNKDDVQYWLEMTPYESQSALQILGNEDNYSGNDQFAGATKKNYKIRIQAPQQIISSDGHRWGQLDSGLIAQGIKGLSEEGLTGFFEKAGDLVKSMGEKLFGDAAKEGLRAIGDRTASNPFSEKYYEAPEFRTFTFSWEFAAESADDAKKLSDIIEAIRAESYPTRLTDNDLYRYKFPSEWKLEILEKEATVIRTHGRMAKSVLTNMSTNYTGAGIVSGFNLNGSHAPFVNLELTFSETNLNHSGSPMIKPPSIGS